MDSAALVAEISNKVPAVLAQELVDAFLEIRRDVATETLGRGAPGKFVETFVQILQHLESGKFDNAPDVDKLLKNADNLPTTIDDGLRICGARLARSMYSIRSKRNIVHKGAVDPNLYDLQLLLAGSQWIVAELLRIASSRTMEETGALVQRVTAPVGGMIEDFGDHRLVHGDFSVADEILVLLHSHYPKSLSVADICKSLERRNAGSVRKQIRTIWGAKLLQGSGDEGYCLTQSGYRRSIDIIRANVA